MASHDGFPYTDRQRRWWFATHPQETEPGPRSHYMEWSPRPLKPWGVYDPEGKLIRKFDSPDHAHAFLEKQLFKALPSPRRVVQQEAGDAKMQSVQRAVVSLVERKEAEMRARVKRG